MENLLQSWGSRPTGAGYQRRPAPQAHRGAGEAADPVAPRLRQGEVFRQMVRPPPAQPDGARGQRPL